MKRKKKKSRLSVEESRHMKKRLLFFVYRSVPACLLLTAAGLVIITLFLLYGRGNLPNIPTCVNETDEFRSMQIKPEILECWEKLGGQTDEDRWKILAVLMAYSAFSNKGEEERAKLPDTLEEYDILAEYYTTHQETELSLLADSYLALLSDLVYFPVMKSSSQKEWGLAYAEAWLAERSYQNMTHSHEGTDIMALNNKRGYYPVVSMTDGVVERLGWLEKGGYRVGIRSPHGAYLYYAHLYCYAEGLKEGDVVRAGQLLGFMGDSGYSKVEGTVGNFDVHLHMGIYLKTKHYEELSVNPYWILKYMEERTVTGDF